MALDDGQDVIELVGQAGSQLADGGQAFLAQEHLLAFLQGALGFLAFGHLHLQTFGPLVNQLENLVVPAAQGPAAAEKNPSRRQGHRRGKNQGADPAEGGRMVKLVQLATCGERLKIQPRSCLEPLYVPRKMAEWQRKNGGMAKKAGASRMRKARRSGGVFPC